MTLNLEIYKCNICGNIIEVVKSGDGDLVCCGQKMVKMEPKGMESGQEKHLPFIKEEDSSIVIKIGETEHPMTEEHYIEWIEVITDEGIFKKYFKPKDKPEFKTDKKNKIKVVRAYCNIHGLWRKSNVEEFGREDLILFAIKSETDAQIVYSNLAKRVKNAFLKERFVFLAGEEEKHKNYFEEFYRETYTKDKIVLPSDDIIPLPKINAGDEKTIISEILSSAMNAELAVSEFYLDLSKLFADMPKTANMLKFFASMEMIHYSILTAERKNAEIFESYENEVPMIHVGP
jgi:superoxide reductase